ncbi:tetratricopeptide repeat protein [Nocardia sp. NRRL S-836]|uniref:tetratricopeptide repeat protein n=1 Tax=Nocardia sp. NRRL S-836 TaxID=1519492 RepID=UPI0006ADBFE6|nr:tetratricopeptide repeat protein [Nocardia sp. NRRL S-836]
MRNDFTGLTTGPVLQVGHIGGNVNFHSRARRHDLRPFSSPAPPDPAELRRQPSQLLLAGNQVVPFTGRENELARLEEWRRGEGRISAMLVHGPGGQGKTRLATEFATESMWAGYSVLVAHHGGDSSCAFDAQFTVTEPNAGILVIVDYAERWPRSDLLALFEDPLIHQAGRTRVLLLARSGARWWDLLRYPLLKRGVAAESERLTDLAADVSARQAVFESARDSFSTVLGTDARDAVPAGSLSDPAYRSVLTILMAALAAVDACDRNRVPPGHPGALACYLLDRETDHWAGMRSGGTVGSSTDVLARVVFLATLTGPMSYRDGCEVLLATGIARSVEEADRLLDDHQACYPPSDDGTVLTPLAPDRLGEDLVARCLKTDPRCHGLVRALLSTPALSRVITVLAETGKRWPHVGEHLDALVREDPCRVIAAGGGALMAVVDSAGTDLLAAIEPRLPERHVDLDFPAARLTQRLTEHRLEQTHHPAERARLLTVLARRLANAGAFDEALKASEPAVRIYEGLVHRQPDKYSLVLAEALHHLGTHLSGAGLGRRALDATGRAVRLRQRLAPLSAELASSLNNLAMDLSALGLRGRALDATRSCVAILHRLPQPHEPALAVALNNLGMHLAGVGRRHEALDAARHSVDLHRRLAAVNPAVFDPDLAGALHNFGLHSSHVGDWVEALEATEQAVAIRRRLAITNPALFEPGLALSLRELAAICLELGRQAEGLEWITQAVDLHRNLATVNPAVYDAELATSLHNHGVHLARAGDHVRALGATRKAVVIRSSVLETHLHAYELRLNTVLTQLGVALPGAPRPSSGGELQRRVDAIFSFPRPGIMQSTDNLAARSATAHRLTTAVCSVHPRWSDHLTPSAAALVTMEALLARSLGNLSSRHADLGKQAEALTAAEQAADTYQRLTALDHTHRTDFATSLALLGTRLAEFGRRDQALAATRYAVTSTGTARTLPVAAALHAFAWVRMLSRLELDDAVRAAEAAVGIYREVNRTSPVAVAAELRLALKTCSALLSQVGRGEESLAIARELRAPAVEVTLRTPRLTELGTLSRRALTQNS